jgi:aspartate aminotransferase
MQSNLSISKRAQKAPYSPIRKLMAKTYKIREKEKIEIFRLNIGQPDFATPCEIKKALCQYQKCGPENLPYAPSEGIWKTILAWQKYFQDQKILVEPRDIIVTSGGSEAIIFAMTVVCDPGDEIIVFEPFYANYKGYVKLSGIKLKPVTLKVETEFRLPAKEKIISKITKKTKAILVCNPSNPTGAVLSQEEIQVLVKIAKKYNLFILADEVYREFILNGKEHISFMHFPEIENQVILLDSVSKRFNACGVRIGALVSKNKEVMENVLKFAQARLSVATAEQKAVIPLLLDAKPYTKKLISEYRRRRDVVFSGLKNIPGAICQKPEGAFYVIAKLPIDSSENFCQWLLERFRYKNKTVLVAPAEDFYQTKGLGKKEVRIAYVLNEKKLAEAMEILRRAVLEYNKNFKS